MNDQKSQIIEKIKSANSILVTISANPTVDQIAACIAMTIVLNKSKKSATAVFSGKVPNFLNFLNPRETMEKDTDSLRDFIIALDKSKADKLRYKVEDDVVKIFITPYRTSITEKDLKYSAGDFNVDVILALGVHHQQDLDTAITAHGRIFHDAVTICINNSPGGDFGVTNWENLAASSMSELVAELVEALDPNLLDAQIATALLTGIVAETGRFSNDKTHPHTMTISSRLLEAGADQKLVNTQLQDLIGAVVNLKAGTEIKPTADTSHEPLHHNDGVEELLIDENGEFKSQPKDKPDVEIKVDAAPPDTSAAPSQPLGSSDLELPDLSKPEDAPAGQLISDVLADAEAAREAIESALSTNHETAVPDVSPAADLQPISTDPEPQPIASSQSFQPQPVVGPAPQVQAISANQPSYANPNTTTQYETPAQPGYEPAPLSMSPDDQAFTMPMPQNDPAAEFGQPSQPAAFPPATSPQPAGPTPPPLPPPLSPPNFG